MPRGITVNDMIDEIRSLSDEENEAQLEDVFDILPSLNRAQEKAWQLLSRIYPDPILEFIDVTVSAGTREVSLVENIWGDKIKRVEWVKQGFHPVPCDQSTLAIISKHYTDYNLTAPTLFHIKGRKLRFNGPTDGTYTLRVWYCKEPSPLVESWGRVTNVDEASNTVYVGEVNSAFDPVGAELPNSDYVNLIDGQTGEVKGSFQISSWDEVDTLVLKSVPDRSKVFNRDIDTSLSSLEVSVEADDYLCHVRGTCLPIFYDEAHTFIIQYTVAEIKRKLGYSYDVDQKLIQDFEIDLRKTIQGRSPRMKMRKTNANWLRGMRRKYRRYVR